jgi:Flp pilus assembly pilin Flp
VVTGSTNVVLLALLARVGRLRREEGQAFVEYAMVMLLVVLVLAAGAFVAPFRSSLESAFSGIGDALSTIP